MLQESRKFTAKNSIGSLVSTHTHMYTLGDGVCLSGSKLCTLCVLVVLPLAGGLLPVHATFHGLLPASIASVTF